MVDTKAIRKIVCPSHFAIPIVNTKYSCVNVLACINYTHPNELNKSTFGTKRCAWMKVLSLRQNLCVIGFHSTNNRLIKLLGIHPE